jgi:hypothetical protein
MNNTYKRLSLKLINELKPFDRWLFDVIAEKIN